MSDMKNTILSPHSSFMDAGFELPGPSINFTILQPAKDDLNP